MEILRNYEALVGKTVAFSHMAQYAEQITIATTDGCVLMAKFGCDDETENPTINVLYQGEVMRVLGSEKGRYVREELGRLGIFDLEEFKRQEEEKNKKAREANKKQMEDRERAEYERLKLKFEGK